MSDKPTASAAKPVSELPPPPWLKWTMVRGFGSIKYFNISYVILAAVPVLHELSRREIVALSAFAEFPVTLKCAYLASVFFALAIAVYQYACPAIIKSFGTRTEYVRSEYDVLSRMYPHKKASTVLTHLDPEIDAEVRRELSRLMEAAEASGKDEDEGRVRAYVDKHYDHAIQTYLSKEYDKLNVSRRLFRWTAYILFFAGTIILVGLLLVRSYAIFFPEDRDMLIKTTMVQGDLSADVFTRLFEEFEIFEDVLRQSGVLVQSSRIPPDAHNRMGNRYRIPESSIARLSRQLGGEFDSQGKFSATATSGTGYACRELTTAGRGSGCVDIFASSNTTAIVKCSMIASNNNWFSGDPKPGACSAAP